MANRISALEGHYAPGRTGAGDVVGITLREVSGLVLHQVAGWPATMAFVGDKTASALDLSAAPDPGQAIGTTSGPALLRTEPLKWWLVGAQPSDLLPDEGSTLDISHSRTCIAIGGPKAAVLLNRHLPLDLREGQFGVNRVASTAFHHIGVTLWRTGDDYRLFLPRGFAVSLWQMLQESAAQFGCEVAPAE